MSLACGMDHVVASEIAYSARAGCPEHRGQVVVSFDAEPDKPMRLIKYVTYHTSKVDDPSELRARAVRTLERMVQNGFERLRADQEAFVRDFWERSDIEVSGPHVHPRLQQVLRWNLFQLLQATARDVPLMTIFRGVMPFIAADTVRLAILILCPGIVLFLPGLM